MKIAILADIHGNLPALQTVVAHIDAWHPDAVAVAGDIVNRGPRPLECLRIIQDKQRRHGWLAVRGNHEDYVLDQARPDAVRSGPEFEIARNAFWTVGQLDGKVKALETLPFQTDLLVPDGDLVRVVHASMRNNRDGIYPETTDEELRHKISPSPPVLCVGHTHRPLIRYIDRTLVVNVGSVGMPFDGDHRAAYARLSWHDSRWQAQIMRLTYDRAQTERDFYESGFLAGAGDLSSIMLVEFRQARPYIYRWSTWYEEAVLSNQVSLADSVRAYLATIEGR